MPTPSEVLMCPPDFYEVRDVKNAFMRNHLGTVDRQVAAEQWHALRRTFERIGLRVHAMRATPHCEDMVFTANPSFNGQTSDGTGIYIPSRMAFRSRQPEVAAHSDWFESRGYQVVQLSEAVERFEGGGDALWHPGRALIWAASGARTSLSAHAELARIFDVPVISLDLTDERFYHLDTCFCALSESSALIYPQAFAPEGLALIRRLFTNVIEVGDEEAARSFTCNAAAFGGGNVVLQRGASRIVDRLDRLGFSVHEVETGEFLKSGGSVYCMKASIY